MRVYSQYRPFIDDNLDTLAELMQWQMIFTMLAALALKVDVVGENIDDVKMFDAMLVGLQFAGPIIAVLMQFVKGGRGKGGVLGVLRGNSEVGE